MQHWIQLAMLALAVALARFGFIERPDDYTSGRFWARAGAVLLAGALALGAIGWFVVDR